MGSLVAFSWRPSAFFNIILLILFLVAYCIQPLLIDIIKINGGARSSTFSIMIPHYYSMMMVGLLPTEKKITECDWRKGMIVSALDIVNQLLKKAGLLYAGAAVYIVVDSSTIVWTAIWSLLLLNRKLSATQWLAIFMITMGVSLKAFQLNISFGDEEFLGVFLISLASILMGLTFVLNEKFMRGSTKIEGPNLVCMMGICSSIVMTLWTIFWTLPKYNELVLEPIELKGGSIHTVMSCSLWLFLSGWLHSGTLWYLMSHFGAVSTGVLKGLKVALVFILSHYLFCEIQPNQCLNFYTATSAIVCVGGVILYSFAQSTRPLPGLKQDKSFSSEEVASTREPTPKRGEISQDLSPLLGNEENRL